MRYSRFCSGGIAGMLPPTSSSAMAISLWWISTPLTRATTGSSCARGAADGASSNAAMATAPIERTTSERGEEAIKRNPLSQGQIAQFLLGPRDETYWSVWVRPSAITFGFCRILGGPRTLREYRGTLAELAALGN